MKRLLFALALLASPLAAETVVYCDVTASPIVGRVLAYQTSVNATPDLYARHGVDLIIDANVSALQGVPVMYWRCNAVPAVVQMTAPQKATLDAYLLDQGETSTEEACKVSVALDPQIRAAFLVVLEEWVNPLRALHSLPAITKAEAKADYDAKCEEILGGGGTIVAATEGPQKRTERAGGSRE